MARSSKDEKQFRQDKDYRSRRRRKSRKRELMAAWTALILVVLVAAGGVVGGVIFFLQLGDRSVSAAAEESREVIRETFPEGEPAAVSRTSEEKAAALLEKMTLERKVAQMFMITPEQMTGYTLVTAAGEASKTAYQTFPVGGLIYFKDNLESPDQVKTMLKNMDACSRQIAGVPVFLGVDEEGGTVKRIGSQPAFQVPDVPDMALVGASGNTEDGYGAGSTIGAYLSDLGFNLDFAPVADVLSNPDNKAMTKRTFGTDPQTVSAYSGRFLDGLRDKGICGVMKHFPGQGSVAGDTEYGFQATDKTLDQLLENDMVPFQAGISQGAEIIMAAHVSAPAVTGDQTPASLSQVLLTEVLRGRLGFDGVVITDALNMGAIAEHYQSDVAAVMAVQAGADMLLMPEDFQVAYDGVLKAVAEGAISRERIDQSVLRILKLKFERL